MNNLIDVTDFTDAQLNTLLGVEPSEAEIVAALLPYMDPMVRMAREWNDGYETPAATLAVDVPSQLEGAGWTLQDILDDPKQAVDAALYLTSLACDRGDAAEAYNLRDF